MQKNVDAENLNAPPMKEPKKFQLTINFRSKAGIVNCAYSIVHLLQKFWPDQIDPLTAEKGVDKGKKPVFFISSDGDSLVSWFEYFT
jgi:hypothetical protein